ncbi:MAG: ribulose-phosphate 3-epimerase [Acidimicrobiia bacterium]|nr:MAG: ribulose-phosphate 3-epimerase [Acidimicrobiia bacterium]
MMNETRISPSILAADFANLSRAVSEIASEIDSLHVDVMDGHFVPNISLGPPVIASIAAATDLYLDCHLMITDPLRYLRAIKDSGGDGVTVHIESVPNPKPAMDEAASLGLDFGLAMSPHTPVDAIDPYLEHCSLVLVMSVEPGFGGQDFMDISLEKITTLRETIDSRALRTDIQVDGGVDLRTIGRARSAGANVFVAGTSVFGADDPLSAIRQLKSIVGVEST